MRLKLTVCTQPDSLENEDAISNALQDMGLRADVETAIEYSIAAVMGWRDIRVNAQIEEPRRDVRPRSIRTKQR